MNWPRRQYLEVLADRAARGDLAALLRHGLAWVRTSVAPRGRAGARPRGLPGPALGTLLVTYRCDLRCRVCDLPARAAARRRAGDRELSTAEFLAVLRDMKAIGTAGVGFTGGEPMLREDLPVLLRAATRLGLHAHLNTDGLHVDRRAPTLLATGLRSVNVSLDGAEAATHDRARGRAGAFAQAVGALEALRAARGRRPLPRLTAVTVLTRHNLDQVEAVAEVALGAGADRLGVIPVHDFGQGEQPVEPERLARGQAALARLAARGVLDNSRAYLDLLPRALGGAPSPLFCYAPYASVVVDCYGDVYPCFPLMERREPVGRLPLGALWRSKAYAEARRRLHACRACLWNCHAELNLALPQGRLAPAAQGPA